MCVCGGGGGERGSRNSSRGVQGPRKGRSVGIFKLTSKNEKKTSGGGG